MRKTVFGIALCLTMMWTIPGCSTISDANNRALAGMVLEAMYAGNCDAFKDRCADPDTLNKTLATFPQAMRATYGDPMGLRYKNSVERGSGITDEYWIVRASRKFFVMQIRKDKDGRILSVGIEVPSAR